MVFSCPANIRFLGGMGTDPNRNSRGKNPVPDTPGRKYSREAA